MGVMADAEGQVVHPKPKDMEPPPTFASRVNVDHLQGMARAGKKFGLRSGMDTVLSAGELIDLASSVATPTEDSADADKRTASSTEVAAGT